MSEPIASQLDDVVVVGSYALDPREQHLSEAFDVTHGFNPPT
jgi:hypothetical protein